MARFWIGRGTPALLALAGLSLLLGADGALAAPEEPWAKEILREVESQRAAVRRKVPPDTIVGRAERAVRRDDSVAQLYGLARAYGLRAQWHRAEADRARAAADKARHDREAEADHASSMATYRDVLQKVPGCYFAYHDMGVLELQRRAPDARLAFQHFSTAYRVNRNYTPTIRQLVNLYLQRKQFDVASGLLQRVVELEPDDDEARRRLAVALAETKQYDAAYREVGILLGRSRDDAAYLTLQAHLDTQTGKWDRAIGTYKRLARANPNASLAFVGLATALDKKSKAGQQVELTDMLFALKGLRRIERDPKRRAELAAEIRKVEHAQAAPSGSAPGAAPTLAQLLHGLDSPAVEVRRQSLYFLLTRKEPATPAVIRAIARRLDARVEPAPDMRMAAVAALGQLSGSVLAPLLRLSLQDADARVRAETADTLAGIGERDDTIAKALVAVLGLHLEDPDAAVVTAARQGILHLSGAVLLGLTEESDAAAHARAFATWWQGPEGRSAQIEALGAYHRMRDKAADQVLVPYLEAEDFFVLRAAYRALPRSAGFAAGDAWRRWYAALPRFDDEQFVRERRASIEQALRRWVSARPGA